MRGKNELIYHLIRNPMSEGETIAYDKYELEKILEELEEGTKITRILNVPEKKDGQESMLLIFERGLCENYKKESQRFRGWKHFLRVGIGGAITYLAFPTLLAFGINLPFRIFGPWRGPWPTQIQIGTFTLGLIFALLPYLIVRSWTRKISAQGSELKKYGKLIPRLNQAELKLVENENLAHFYEDTEALVKAIHEEIKGLTQTKSKDKKLKACRNIQKYLQRIFGRTKSYGLYGLDEYFYGLQTSFYSLEKLMEKPRFWRNDEKYIRKIIMQTTYAAGRLGGWK